MTATSINQPWNKAHQRIQSSRGAQMRWAINRALLLVWRPFFRLFMVGVCAYLIVPTIVVVLASVSDTSYVTFPPQGLTLKWFGNFFSRPGFLQSLALSASLATVIAILAVVVSVLLSILFGRKASSFQAMAVSLAYMPLLLPTIVYGPALLLWASKLKLVQSFWGTALTLGAAHLVLALPFALQSILVGYERLDPAYEEAALVMGARPGRAFRDVTLPLLMPAIIAGATFSFLISFDEPVVALFFTRIDFITLPVQIFQYLRYKPDPTIAAIATVMIVVSMGLVVIADRFIGLGRLMGLRR